MVVIPRFLTPFEMTASWGDHPHPFSNFAYDRAGIGFPPLWTGVSVRVFSLPPARLHGSENHLHPERRRTKK